MSTRARKPYQRRHVQIYDEDWEFLGHYCPAIGPVVRGFLHLYVRRLKSQLADKPAEQQHEAMRQLTAGLEGD